MVLGYLGGTFSSWQVSGGSNTVSSMLHQVQQEPISSLIRYPLQLSTGGYRNGHHHHQFNDQPGYRIQLHVTGMFPIQTTKREV